VAREDFADALFQSDRIHGAFQTDDKGDVISRATRPQLMKEPQALLRERELQTPLTRDPLDGRQPRRLPFSDRRLYFFGQPGHGGRLEQAAERQLDAQGVLNPGDDFRRHQRMPAQLEEVVV
jgi:hypothetical protein